PAHSIALLRSPSPHPVARSPFECKAKSRILCRSAGVDNAGMWRRRREWERGFRRRGNWHTARSVRSYNHCDRGRTSAIDSVDPNCEVAHPAPKARLSQISLVFQQLRIEQRRSRRAADGVVREHGELPVEHVAGTQAPNGSGHSVAEVDIKARLRAIMGLYVANRNL